MRELLDLREAELDREEHIGQFPVEPDTQPADHPDHRRPSVT